MGRVDHLVLRAEFFDGLWRVGIYIDPEFDDSHVGQVADKNFCAGNVDAAHVELLEVEPFEFGEVEQGKVVDIHGIELERFEKVDARESNPAQCAPHP